MIETNSERNRDKVWRLMMKNTLHLRSVQPRYGRLKFSPILQSLRNPRFTDAQPDY